MAASVGGGVWFEEVDQWSGVLTQARLSLHPVSLREEDEAPATVNHNHGVTRCPVSCQEGL